LKGRGRGRKEEATFLEREEGEKKRHSHYRKERGERGGETGEELHHTPLRKVPLLREGS